MTGEKARAVLLSLDDATEGWHRGHPDFRVGGKIFASFPKEGFAVLRLEPAFAESLGIGRVVSRPGGMAWMELELAPSEPDEFRALAEAAHASRRGGV